jgi:hypothetical protein
VWHNETAWALVRRALDKPKLGYLLVVSMEENDRECFTLVIATAENEAYEQSNQTGQLAGLVRLDSFT